MNKPGFTTILGLSLLLFSWEGVSQERSQKSQRPAASDFNIQLINLDSPSYRTSVPVAGERSGYVAHGRLRRIPEWKPSKEVPSEVSALRIEFWLEEGAVRIDVMAYLGQSEPHSRPWEWGKLKTARVASRLVRENETISIDETERFGIEPFSVKVSRAEPWSVGVPEIINKTQALTVTRITESRPTYTLTVRNVSHKHISSIRWYDQTNGRKGGGSGLSGERIIGPGSIFDIYARFDLAETRRDYSQPEPEESPKRAIVIAALVFEDGTFEGEVDECAEMAASLAGQRIQLLRAIQLLRDISLIPGDDHAPILSKLKRDIASLGEDVDLAVVKELATRFETASEDTRNRRMREEVSSSLKFVKTHLSEQIEKFEYQRSHAPNEANLESWLKETIEQLERMSGSY